MALYKIVDGGPFSRWEPTAEGLGETHRTYAEGETVELDPAEAERLNAEAAKIDRDARRVELALGRDEGSRGSASVFAAAEQAPSDAVIAIAAPTDPAPIGDEDDSGPTISLPGTVSVGADLPPQVEPGTLVEAHPPLSAATPPSEDAAPDWATYLAATSPSEACAAITALASPDDIRAALAAERAGSKRPRIIKAAVARLKELGTTVAG